MPLRQRHSRMQWTGRARAAVLAGAALWLGCAGGPPPIDTCVPADGLTPICGFTNPEDIVALGEDWLLVSEMSRDDSGGRILAFRPSDGARHVAFESAKFYPHGIDLSADGSRLLVVDHGDGEAVGEYAVERTADGAPTLSLVRHTAVPEALDANLNDVAFTDTGFVTTKMMSTNQFWSSLQIATGNDSGELLTWSEAAGWNVVADSAGSGPNGVAASPDGKTFFLAEWGAGRIVRVDASGGGRVESAPIGFSPDNLSWASDGKLLVGGQVATAVEATACFSVPESTNCGLGTRVVKVDPETLAVEPVLDHHPATVMGGASVAIEQGGRIWLGTFSGDRLAWMVAP